MKNDGNNFDKANNGKKRSLQEVLSFYEALYKDSRDIVLVTGKNGEILEANEAAIEAYGYGREELLTLNISRLRAPDTLGEIAKQLSIAQNHGIVFETVHRRKDGSTFPVEVNSRGIFRGKEPVKLSIVRDISEKVLAVEEKRLLTNYIRLLLDSVNEGVYGSDTAGRCTFINRVGANILGFEPSELIGKEVHNIIHHTDADGKPLKAEDCMVMKAIKEGVNVKADDDVYWRSDGTSFPVEISCSPVWDNNIIVGSVVTFSDISLRKQADKAIKDQKAFLENMLQSSAIATFAVDNDHKAIIWNKACEELSGLKAECVLGTNEYWRIFYPEKRQCLVDYIIDGQLPPDRSEFSVFHESEVIPRGIHTENWINFGRKRYLIADAAPICDSDGKVIAAIEMLQDITERKLAQEAVNRNLILAGQIQRSSLPADFNNSQFTVTSFYQPLHIISGDFFHFRFDEKANILSGYLVDVMGHGFATALQTAALRVLFTQALERHLPVDDTLYWINEESAQYFDEGSFAAAICFQINGNTMKLSYAAGGINHFFYRRNGTVKITASGCLLGLLPEQEYEKHELNLCSGDSLMFLSDGILDLLRDNNPDYTFSDFFARLAILSSERAFRDDASAIGILVR